MSNKTDRKKEKIHEKNNMCITCEHDDSEWL